MNTKTIFITIGETAAVRNIIRTDFWQTLLSREDIRVVLVTMPGVVDVYRSEFGSDKVSVVSVPPARVSFFEKLLAFFARNGFYTKTNVLVQHRAYESRESRLPSWPKQILGILVGRIRLFQTLIRYLDCTISPSPKVAELFDTHKPDLVFSTIVINTVVDIPVLREAKRRGIRTLGMVRGWDNMTSYGFVRMVPDLFLAQNDFLKEEAVSRHFLSPQKVLVVGTPYFDFYSNREKLLISRERYCEKMGIDPKTRIILYAAVGDFLFSKEGELALVFEELIGEGKIKGPATVVFRAHPAFDSPLQKMKGLKHVRPDRSASYLEGSFQMWDMNTAQTAHLVNSLYHADVVVTAGSTIMIEAALMQKPVITVAFDGLSGERYWFSVKRFYDHFTHIMAILKTGGVRVARNKEELAQTVNFYFENLSADNRGRERIVERFAGPHNGQSGRRLAGVVLGFLSGSVLR